MMTLHALAIFVGLLCGLLMTIISIVAMIAACISQKNDPRIIIPLSVVAAFGMALVLTILKLAK